MKIEENALKNFNDQCKVDDNNINKLIATVFLDKSTYV